MATLEQENEKRQELGKVLADLAEIKPEDLVRDDDLGRELNFAAGQPYFTRTLRLFRDLRESNLDTVPFNALNQLTNIARQALSQFKQVQQFSLQQHPQNPGEVRDGVINQIRDSYDNYFQQAAPIIAYSVRKGTDFEQLENNARETLAHLKSIVTEQEKSRVAMLSEVEGTLEKIRRAAQEVGVAQHATHFKEQADDHKVAANRWLWTTAILGAMSLAFAIGSFLYYLSILSTLTASQAIQLAVGKLIIFSVLFSGVFWTARIYRAHRHNYVVNKHRQNALSTFETFAKAANDDQTKSAVLIQATQCIFSLQHTGYLSQESDSTSGYPQVLEIVRGIAGTQQKT